MSITERLQKIVDYLGTNPNSFAAKIGISQPRMRNYLNGRLPDYDALNKICKTFVMINPCWLLTGEGDMLVSESEDKNKNSVTERSHIQELIQIIQNQAKALLEQQQFINAHFPKAMRDQISTPPLSDVEKSPDIEHIKD